MSGRPRKYDFAWLRVGDRLIVAAHECDPEQLRASIASAANSYRHAHDAGFVHSTSTTLMPGFVVLERIAAGVGHKIHRDKARATIARLSRQAERFGLDAATKQQMRGARRRLQECAA